MEPAAGGSPRSRNKIAAEMPQRISPQKRAIRRGHRRSSSAPVFLDQFNSTLSPLCEDAEEQEPEEDTPPKEDRSLHWLNVAAIKRQRELQRLSPLTRPQHTWSTSDDESRIMSSPLAKCQSPQDPPQTSPLAEDSDAPTPDTDDADEEPLKAESTATKIPEASAEEWPSEADRRQFEQLLIGSLSHNEDGSASATNSPLVRRSTMSDDFRYPARSDSDPESSARGCLKTKSLSDDHLTKSVVFNVSGSLYRPDSAEGLRDDRERVRSFKLGLRSRSRSPPVS